MKRLEGDLLFSLGDLGLYISYHSTSSVADNLADY